MVAIGGDALVRPETEPSHPRSSEPQRRIGTAVRLQRHNTTGPLYVLSRSALIRRELQMGTKKSELGVHGAATNVVP